MLLDTSGIHEGHSMIRQGAELESVKENLPSLVGPVQCEAELDRHEGTIVAHVRFSCRFEQQCARCLKEYEEQVASELRLILQEVEGKSGAAGENESADYYFNSSDFIIDIGPSIYDEIMISLPLKPLCSENCIGMMYESKAGGGLTEKPEENGCDPRWEALRKLQKKT